MTPIIQQQPELVTERYGEESYEYYPLGEYVVMAPGVCGGRPTFKYSRIEVSIILAQLRTGRTVQEIVDGYHSKHLTVPAINEALSLADDAFRTTTSNIFSSLALAA